MPVEGPVLGGEEEAIPGAAIAIQSFGDFLGFKPPLHVLGSTGCFYGGGPTSAGENIARYIIRAFLSRERLPTIVQPATVYVVVHFSLTPKRYLAIVPS